MPQPLPCSARSAAHLGQVVELQAGVWLDDIHDVLRAQRFQQVLDENLDEWICRDGPIGCA